MVALYRRHVHEVYGFFWNQVGRAEDAEDLTSETFLRAMRGLPGFQGRSSYRTWLFEIARRQLVDQWRREGRRPRTVPLDIPLREPEEPAPVASPARVRLGRAVLAALPEHYRTVLIHRILDDRSVKETAALMGKTENHVKVLTHRALRRAAAVATALEAGR
jgi:RNA polymerase sigma-70 factor (ECF subfamily)